MQFHQLPLSQNVVQSTTTVSGIQSIFAMATQILPATITSVSQDTFCVKNFEGQKFCKFHNKYQSLESIVVKALCSFVSFVVAVWKHFSCCLKNFLAYSTSSSPLPVKSMPFSTRQMVCLIYPHNASTAVPISYKTLYQLLVLQSPAQQLPAFCPL